MTVRKILACCFCLFWCSTHLPAQKRSTGKATYYSDKLHGRRMSNGDAYHRDSMTCAHKNYPLGTLLKVRNPINDKEVVVKVTDRGPFSRRFIIDLSKAAAHELGFIQQGFCQVEITRVTPNEVPLRPENDDEMSELHLEYQDLSSYPEPIWKQQAILQEKKPLTTPIRSLNDENALSSMKLADN
ncbi:MAG: septal ring lytic transglycosylase RlpA family protein [Paraprevotella sp.]|nr:septal ring lytic transglycosylase RlpA family protein [Paraprevotella sp.]